MLWETLTVDEFAASIEKTKGVCLIPLGCMEKHGNHLPLGTDMYICREVCKRAAEKEEVMIFPYYPIGVVGEAKHKLGAIAIDSMLQLTVMKAICEEISRNGYKKIVLCNAHGGNLGFIRFFAQIAVDEKRDYTVYSYTVQNLTKEDREALNEKYGELPFGLHADVIETSDIMAIAPETVHMDRMRPEDSVSQRRAEWYSKHGVYTGINWYASFPNHFAGDPTKSSAQLGEDILAYNADHLAEIIHTIKNDDTLPELYKEFYEDSETPRT